MVSPFTVLWLVESMLIAGYVDMKEHFVIDPLIGKRQQLLLATQLCRMVLKVNNVIVTGSGEDDF
jgi:T-complex protein 1 subunit epsilon